MMENFMLGAVREFAFKNYPVSMACACIFLDATAKQEIGGRVGERCKKFVDRYLDIISVVGTGGAILAMPGAKMCVPDPMKPGCHSPIQDIIYYVIRNCLVHEAELSHNVKFTEDAFLGSKRG